MPHSAHSHARKRISHFVLCSGVLRSIPLAWQEEFYLEENVGKAIAIDEWSADALTTSMVDDVFFILQKCGRRALATGNLQCLCAILGQINNLLSNSLRTALELNWKVLLLQHAPCFCVTPGFHNMSV